MDIHDLKTQVSGSGGDSQSVKEAFGRFSQLELLGEGGMARVYRAFDPTLGRTVALKFIRGDDPEMAERLLMEARSQARIEHKHVCKVYEAGEAEGRPYIAMQLVEGRTLDTLASELNIEQKVKLVAEVAEAVHVAHKAGLIHRDLKPANILVERDAAGEWIPYVMDFGLAREVAAPGLTASGTVVGSPWYMSPEQARGNVRALDRRSDVYSLGATLYQLVSGKLPFEGEGAIQVLMRIVNEEPVPPSRVDSSVPVDLDAIVLKCLEKDPGRRYDSARALAEDLQRYLDGEPVLARPSGLLYRVSKRIRRNKAAYASAAVALLAIAVFAFLGIHARVTSAREAALAQEFGQILKDMEWRMRIVHMTPLHDIRSEKREIGQGMELIRARMKDAPGPATGLANYALGRGEMALGNYVEARRRLESAWSQDYRGADAAFALGYTLSVLYRQELQQAEKIRNEQLRTARLKQIQSELRDPARKYLALGRANNPGYRDFIEGLLAFYDQQYEVALRKAESAATHLPWLYEAVSLQGDIYSALHRKELMGGREHQAAEAQGRAEEKYLASLRIGQSDPEAHRGLCSMRANRMSVKFFEGGDLEPYYAGSVAACNDALQVDPDAAVVLAELCGVFRLWGEYQAYQGKSPEELFQRAAEYGTRALKLAPQNARTHALMSQLYRVQAEYEQERGMPAEKSLDLTFEYQKKAVDLNPQDATILNGMGNALLVRSLNKYMKGEDVRPDAEGAAAYYRKALEIVPEFSYVLNNLGTACSVIAWYEMEHGIEPGKSSAEAIQNFQEAIRRQSENETAYYNLGILYRRLAELHVQRGGNPEPMLDRAEETFRREIQINPDPTGDVYAEQAAVRLLRAQHTVEHGNPDETLLRETIALLEKTIELRPDLWNARQLLAEARLTEARVRILQAEDPSASFRQAVATLEPVVKGENSVTALPLSLAKIYREKAEWELSRGANPAKDVAAGLTMIDRATAINANDAEVSAVRGALLLLQMRASGVRDGCSASRNAMEQALERNAFLARRYNTVQQQIDAHCGIE